jgi:hypothetical protein
MYGKTEEAKILIEQGRVLLDKEFCVGVRRFEEALFLRLEEKLSENRTN